MSNKLNKKLKFISKFLIVYFVLFLCILLFVMTFGDKVDEYFLVFFLDIFFFIVYGLVVVTLRFVPVLCFLLKVVLERKYIKLLLLDFLCLLLLILNYVFNNGFMFMLFIIGTIAIQLYFICVLKKCMNDFVEIDK